MDRNWRVGAVQTAVPEHQAGLRWFVCEGPKDASRLVAWTRTREDAELIVQALHALSP
jgi:hypothetical protein